MTSVPSTPSATWKRKSRPALRTAGQTPETCEARAVKTLHLAGELHERGLAEALDQIVDLRSRTSLLIVLARPDRRVDVHLALTPARHDALAVESLEDRHDGRVRQRLAGARVDA